MNRAICAIATLASVFTAQISAAQPSVGKIAKVSGVARLQRGAQELAVIVAMSVVIGDKIRTMKNAQLSVMFNDGSSAELGESSLLAIEKYALNGTVRESSLLAVLAGRLRTIVKVAIGTEPSFEVHTPNAVIAVRGTDFETAYIEGRACPEDRSCMRYTTVGVSKGVVAVSNPGNPAAPIEVHEGYETTIPCEAPATSPAPLGMEEMGAPGYH